ncbi:hypothetical protein ACHAWF_004857 [Thalassiosira exigua]
MGLCISALEAVDESVNDFLDRQSRYHKESKLAKEHLAQKKNSTATSTIANGHAVSVLQSDLSPIHPSLPTFAEKQKFSCKSVYDGDTLTLDDGRKVRLLGIDTPELREKQAFALEAKEYTKKYCHGREIWLSYQEVPSDDNNKDRYGRLLAFVWVPLNEDRQNNTVKGFGKRSRQSSSTSNSQWLCINEALVANGLAHVYSPSNSKKLHNHDKLLGLQRLARVNRHGQWKHFTSYDAIVTPKGTAFHKCKTKKNTESDCKFLARSKNLSLISVSDAYDKGLHPCRNCFG